jgi:replicative DNA helicase
MDPTSPPSPAATAALLDRPLPYDREAEVGVLGSMMLLPDVVDDVVMLVRAAEFYDDAHQRIFTHLVEMHEQGKKIDLTLLRDRLMAAGDFERIGGVAYLGKLINAVPNAAHAAYYAEIVRAKATYRSMIQAGTEIVRDAYHEAQPAQQLLSQAEQRIFSILDDRSQKAFTPLKDLLHQSLDRIEARQSGTHAAGGCESGFDRLDEQTSGLHDGELIVLAARPSMGKTAFALNIAANVAIRQLVPTLFVSLEMSAIELTDRLLCAEARVNSHRVRAGTLSIDDVKTLTETAAKISLCPFFVDDSPSRTVTEIAAAARRILRREGKLGLIVIDYLQLIEPDNPRDPRQEQVSRMTRRLKGLAREMKVPIVCLAQLNRQTEAGKDNIPRLSHLRESGAIEQDADVVMFVHREEYYHHGEAKKDFEGKASIIVAKQRNGPVGDVELAWFKEFTRFDNLAAERFSAFDSYNQNQGEASVGF